MSRHDESPGERSMNEHGSTAFRAEWDDQGHATEDTIFAWLDGALDPVDDKRMALHTSSCEACREATAEARGYIAASSRILHSADLVVRAPAPGSSFAETAARIALLDVKPTPKRAYNRTMFRVAAAILVTVSGAMFTLRYNTSASVETSGELSKQGSAPASAPVSISSRAPGSDSLTRVAGSDVTAGANTSAKNEVAVRTPRTQKNQFSRPAKSRVAVKRDTTIAQPLAGVNVTAEYNAARRHVAMSSIAPFVAEEIPMTRTLTGVVLDSATFKPLSGVSVIITGTPSGVLTDDDGKFTMERVPAAAQKLQVRRIGYAAAEVEIGASANWRRHVRVALNPQHLALQAFVATTSISKPPPSTRCTVIDAELNITDYPLVRRFILTDSAGRTNAVMEGWPHYNSSRPIELTRDAKNVLRGSATETIYRVEIELVEQGEFWFSTVRQYEGADVRSENVKYLRNGAALRCNK